MNATFHETTSSDGRSDISIVSAVSPAQVDDVRDLWNEFRGWLAERYRGVDRWLVDTYFDPEGWSRELTELPGEYGPDRGGALLLATDGPRAIGVVAMRALDAETAEMKRMFVTASARGRGVAHRLVEATIASARTLGYRTLVLDTGFRQHEAFNLYRAHGFELSSPPYPVDDRLAEEGLTFMSRKI